MINELSFLFETYAGSEYEQARSNLLKIKRNFTQGDIYFKQINDLLYSEGSDCTNTYITLTYKTKKAAD